MSWCIAASVVETYPKEAPDLAHIPDGHLALAAFDAAGFGRALLAGAGAREGLRQAGKSGYGDIFPDALPAYVASANWAAVTNLDAAERLQQFFRLCLEHKLGVSMH